MRQRWGLGTGPLTHLARRMEAHGIVVLTPPADGDLASVDAYSTARLPLPVVVLTPNRADEVYRHRFSAARLYDIRTARMLGQLLGRRTTGRCSCPRAVHPSTAPCLPVIPTRPAAAGG